MRYYKIIPNKFKFTKLEVLNSENEFITIYNGEYKKMHTHTPVYFNEISLKPKENLNLEFIQPVKINQDNHIIKEISLEVLIKVFIEEYSAF